MERDPNAPRLADSGPTSQKTTPYTQQAKATLKMERLSVDQDRRDDTKRELRRTRMNKAKNLASFLFKLYLFAGATAAIADIALRLLHR